MLYCSELIALNDLTSFNILDTDFILFRIYYQVTELYYCIADNIVKMKLD